MRAVLHLERQRSCAAMLLNKKTHVCHFDNGEGDAVCGASMSGLQPVTDLAHAEQQGYCFQAAVQHAGRLRDGSGWRQGSEQLLLRAKSGAMVPGQANGGGHGDRR